MIRVDFDTSALVASLNDFQKRQIPYALSLAFNETQKSRQAKLRTHITSNLAIRSSGNRKLFGDAVRFLTADKANKKVVPMSATLRIFGGSVDSRSPVNQRLGGMILRQNEGGPRTSSALYRASSGSKQRFVTGGFVIPAPGLRGATKAMPKKLYPYALGLTPQLAIAGGDQFNMQYKGGRKKKGAGFKKNTRFYFVKPDEGIFVREQRGGKESEYDAIWFFRRRISLPRRLRLEEVYRDGLPQELDRNFNAAFEKAMRTAR